MKIKRYVVREMQEAIKLIKKDLGPEAVIVSSYRVPPKGLAGLFMPKQLEVTAALDEPQDVARPVKKTPVPVRLTVAAGRRANRQADIPPAVPFKRPVPNESHLYLTGGHNNSSGLAEATVKPRLVEIPEPAVSRGWPQSRQEVFRRDGLFEALVNKELAVAGDSPDWRRALLEMDVDDNIVDTLLAGLADEDGSLANGTDSVYLSIKRRVTQLLETTGKFTEKARVLTFVGPAGVGKTTTLAKLATRLCLNEQKKVALVAVQAYRFGATEQLQVYGDLLGVPVDVVMTPADLAGVLAKHGDKDVILVDTAGRSARNSGHLLELRSFINAVQDPQEIYLVLDLTRKNRDLHRTVKEFLRVKCTKMIFTKLDETDTFGSLLNMVAAYGIPVAYLADGQGVPDCLNEAGPRSIAELLLRRIAP